MWWRCCFVMEKDDILIIFRFQIEFFFVDTVFLIKNILLNFNFYIFKSPQLIFFSYFFGAPAYSSPIIF
jgi:hypothetical protein